MTILTPSTNPSNLLSSPSNNKRILSALSPAYTHSLYLATICQRLLSTTTLFLFLRAYLLSVILFQHSLYASQVLFVQGSYASALLSRQLFWTTKLAIKMSWKATEKLRAKLFYELVVFVLGSGNGLLLFVFWPGWIVIGGGAWGIWWVCG